MLDVRFLNDVRFVERDAQLTSCLVDIDLLEAQPIEMKSRSELSQPPVDVRTTTIKAHAKLAPPTYHLIVTNSLEVTPPLPGNKNMLLDTSTSSAPPARRTICPSCTRPARVCLCDSLPLTPVKLNGQVIVLRHKHELKKPLATIPTLQLCLKDQMTVVHAGGGKRFLALSTRGKEVDDVFEVLSSTEKKIFVLFPGPGAIPLDSCLLQDAEGQDKTDTQDPVPSSSKGSGSDRGWILVAIDGTWREAREMWQSLKTELCPPKGKGALVILPPKQKEASQLAGEGQEASQVAGEGQEEGPGEGSALTGACLIRKEPVEGYLTTYEAICRAVAILGGEDKGLEEVLLKPLRRMTEHQATFDPAVASRCPWALGSVENEGEEPPSSKKLKAGYRHRGELNNL